ncbi:MAG TPA: phosphatase PAP2 family protein [Gaiellaceae bacterium]|nr:phosphatase PAP2 family protein [Gaiellaceae bacterium]
MFFATLIAGLVVISACSVAAGVLLANVLSHSWGIGTANRHVVAWLAGHRTPGRTSASLVGSIMAGGVTLPIVVAAIGLVCAIFRKWRIAAFAVFGLIAESSAYRITTFFFHEHRPRVPRLEKLPVNASYPSGHTAASIAVYCGIALLLTSKFANPVFRVAVWAIAVSIPIFVGLSRMYRGMHYPLDVLGGAFVGSASFVLIVFACRVAGAAAAAREDPAAR